MPSLNQEVRQHDVSNTSLDRVLLMRVQTLRSRTCFLPQERHGAP